MIEQKKRNKSAIPPQRMAIYALLFESIPIIFALIFSSNIVHKERQLLSETEEKHREIVNLLQNQNQNRRIIHFYQNRDPFYLNRTLGLYTPLQKELKILEELQKYESIPDSGAQEKRYSYLKNGNNNFTFLESAATILPLFKETTEAQTKQVEVEEGDLKHIFQCIEGEDSSLTRPQLIVLDAQLERKKGYNREVWGISLKLLKRIYTSTTYCTVEVDENTKGSN